MAVIGRLLVHHGLMEAQGPIDALIAGFSDVFSRPRPVDALLSFTVAEEYFTRKLV